MLALRALAPDGSAVEGFSFAGSTVTYEGAAPVEAGIRAELELPETDDPRWLVPGVFYGENRVEACTRLYPRFTPGRVDVERMESDAWSFRADRCSTPAVFSNGRGLVTSEVSPLGQAGVGFALRDGRPVLWLDFPYREEPLRYDGSETPQPPDVQTYRWEPGERVELRFEVADSLPRPAAAFADPSRVSLEEAAELAAWGLYHSHFESDPPRLPETRSFDGAEVRDHMHVSWVSGVPYAYALLRHGLRVENQTYVGAATAVLDHVAGNLGPGGTFWSQWTHDRGWTWGWHPDHDRAHARTIADATLFLHRASRLSCLKQQGSVWRDAVRSNLDVACRTQRDDGALPAAHHVETGDPVSWEGTAGMAWIPALVEAGHVAEARAAGDYFRRFETWYGAPEDVDLAPTHEDGVAAVMAAVALEDWEWARRAADWMLTFRYTYDVAFEQDTTLGRLGFRTRGADTASPANQHLHAFALICLPEMLRLADATGDDYYRRSALENLACFRQCIARHDGDFGARKGMAAERYLQTDCFGPKGGLLPLSHAWSIGVLLLRGGAGAPVRTFPDGFLWGVATSAFQIEGALDVDGRGESIWDRFCRVPGAVANGDTGDVACDHYRLWHDDVDLLGELGVNAYRFSIAWPRLLPTGRAPLERRGLEHYDRLIDALLERGIEPVATLYHWDLPQALEEESGWRSRDTAERFAEYAAACFDAYGDRVRWWVTINEPWIVGLLGYLHGLHAPGYQGDVLGEVTVFHHLLLAHGRAVQAFRASGKDGRIGLAPNLSPHYPASDDPADAAVSHASDGYVNRWFLDPIFRGSYPQDMWERYEEVVGPLDFVREGDLETIAAPTDYLGVNYYAPRVMQSAPGDTPWPWRVVVPEGVRTTGGFTAGVASTEAGTPIVPVGLTELLVRLRDDYGDVPILITENGAVYQEPLHDEARIRFIHDHLAALHDALEQGVRVLGYCHWSFLDNFEWALGYAQRFGLVHVDYETLARTVKDSGRYYARVARANALLPVEAA